MKTISHENQAGQTRNRICYALFGVLLGIVTATLPVVAGADDSYQYNALFNPGKSQLNAETRGRVMIYDGLENEVIEHALDNQFERIEHMMFTSTKQTQPDGDVIVDDDDC
jgi:hypothetical protein